MCKCNECDKKDTEMCCRILETVRYQQNETMQKIQIEALKNNYNNLLRGMEKITQLISQDQFYRIKEIEDKHDSRR